MRLIGMSPKEKFVGYITLNWLFWIDLAARGILLPIYDCYGVF
jgi:hypothetical protein